MPIPRAEFFQELEARQSLTIEGGLISLPSNLQGGLTGRDILPYLKEGDRLCLPNIGTQC